MAGKLRLMRVLVGLGGAMLVFAPTGAFAHENVGGDELAASNWMLIGAVVVIVMGVLAGLWAMKDGQFSNIEESKYRMVELSEDYDVVMAEAEERERAARAAEDAARAAQKRPQIEPATGQTAMSAEQAARAKL